MRRARLRAFGHDVRPCRGRPRRAGNQDALERYRRSAREPVGLVLLRRVGDGREGRGFSVRFGVMRRVVGPRAQGFVGPSAVGQSSHDWSKAARCPLQCDARRSGLRQLGRTRGPEVVGDDLALETGPPGYGDSDGEAQRYVGERARAGATALRVEQQEGGAAVDRGGRNPELERGRRRTSWPLSRVGSNRRPRGVDPALMAGTSVLVSPCCVLARLARGRRPNPADIGGAYAAS